MDKYKVLVLGGYGFFGSRLTQRLARHAQLHLQIAGRSQTKGLALLERLRANSSASLEAVVIDTETASLAAEFRRWAPSVVINAAGPFQGADYRIPLACIEAGMHYIDLADGRDFVCGIGALDAAAKAAGRVVLSGASSVPALSSSAVDTLAAGLAEVLTIDIGISPGNRTERGLSTVRGILSYCGKRLSDGESEVLFGWKGAWRHAYPVPVGSRLLSPCDVPDLTLLPDRYPGHPSVRFGAGLELAFLHRGMNAMAWLASVGVVKDWSRHARILKLAADLFKHRGSDVGAMHVEVKGRDGAGHPKIRAWRLVAAAGDGPFVPTIAAAALVLKLCRGLLSAGARPCIGELTLDEFAGQMDGLAIRMDIEK